MSQRKTHHFATTKIILSALGEQSDLNNTTSFQPSEPAKEYPSDNEFILPTIEDDEFLDEDSITEYIARRIGVLNIADFIKFDTAQKIEFNDQIFKKKIDTVVLTNHESSPPLNELILWNAGLQVKMSIKKLGRTNEGIMEKARQTNTPILIKYFQASKDKKQPLTETKYQIYKNGGANWILQHFKFVDFTNPEQFPKKRNVIYINSDLFPRQFIDMLGHTYNFENVSEEYPLAIQIGNAETIVAAKSGSAQEHNVPILIKDIAEDKLSLYRNNGKNWELIPYPFVDLNKLFYRVPLNQSKTINIQNIITGDDTDFKKNYIRLFVDEIAHSNNCYQQYQAIREEFNLNLKEICLAPFILKGGAKESIIQTINRHYFEKDKEISPIPRPIEVFIYEADIKKEKFHFKKNIFVKTNANNDNETKKKEHSYQSNYNQSIVFRNVNLLFNKKVYSDDDEEALDTAIIEFLKQNIDFFLAPFMDQKNFVNWLTQSPYMDKATDLSKFMQNHLGIPGALKLYEALKGKETTVFSKENEKTIKTQEWKAGLVDKNAELLINFLAEKNNTVHRFNNKETQQKCEKELNKIRDIFEVIIDDMDYEKVINDWKASSYFHAYSNDLASVVEISSRLKI